MKTKLFFILISSFLFGQNPELFSNNWYISQIQMNGQSTNSPAMNISIPASTFDQSGSGYGLNSRYFNTTGVQLVFLANQSSFTQSGGGCTLADYGGPNWQNVRPYDQKNCDFYLLNNTTQFNYEILHNGTARTLIITNPSNGDKIFYNNSFLGTKENLLKKTFRIYPNPSSNFLFIEVLEKNLKVKIYDLSGKLLFETLSSGKTLKLDVSNFQKGQYILSIENSKPEFFIKN